MNIKHHMGAGPTDRNGQGHRPSATPAGAERCFALDRRASGHYRIYEPGGGVSMTMVGREAAADESLKGRRDVAHREYRGSA